MKKYFDLLQKLKKKKYNWLITGVAGFIGSNLLESLLRLDQKVVGIDNFSTGKKKNLEIIKSLVSKNQWNNFNFIRADICNFNLCNKACKNIDFVLHQAALGSVPRSIIDPISTNHSNIDGFVNIINAAKNQKVKSFTYASSSSVYGDHFAIPKKESKIGNPLSPYAVTKFTNELYAGVFYKNYSFSSIGLIYFNVFGKLQDPKGSYAAVIPKWISQISKNQKVLIYGDGNTTRDFCYIENVIQANLLAATAKENAKNHIYNIAVGKSITLLKAYQKIKSLLLINKNKKFSKLFFKSFRNGDIRHSTASIKKSQLMLGYMPTHNFDKGIKELTSYVINNQKL